MTLFSFRLSKSNMENIFLVDVWQLLKIFSRYVVCNYFAISWSCGATDNASDYGSEDSRFESWQDRSVYFFSPLPLVRLICIYIFLWLITPWREPKHIVDGRLRNVTGYSRCPTERCVDISRRGKQKADIPTRACVDIAYSTRNWAIFFPTAIRVRITNRIRFPVEV